MEIAVDTYKYPINWFTLPTFPNHPKSEPRDIYQLDEAGDPFNTIRCSEEIAEIIWPDGNGTHWYLDPKWCPWGLWDGISLEEPHTPEIPEETTK